MANTLDQNHTSVSDGFEFIFGTNARKLMGMFFRAGASGPISRASISLFRAGSPSDNMRLKVYDATNAAGSLSLPSATAIITSTTSVVGSGLPSYPSPVSLANAPFVDFDFDGSASFVSGNYYLLSAERTGSYDDTDRYGWSATSSDTYAEGGQVAGDGNATWATGSTLANVSNNDQTFRTYYDPALGSSAGGNFLGFLM